MTKDFRKESMATIAGKAGCSVATVSRVLNGVAERNRITRETANKVMSIVRESGYVPPRLAQKTRKRRSGSIGLLLPSVANPYFAEMAGSVVQEANSHQFSVLIMDSQEDEDRFADCLYEMAASDVTGIIAVPCGDCQAILDKIGRRTPLVMLDRYFREVALPFVTCNNYQGGFDATQALLSAGCRHIVAIQGPETSLPNSERVRGYMGALSLEGLSGSTKVVGNEFSQRCGYVETKYLLSAPEKPDAIFALSNTIMLGAIKAIRESGLRIPDDISLISFDDNTYMDYMSPTISSVSQPVSDMASLAFKLLLDRINGETAAVSKIMLSPKLYLRESIKLKHKQ